MTTIKEIYDFLDNLYPFKTAMDFDNVGLLIGSSDDILKSVLVSLDITEEIIEEAISKNVNLIITHHPIIFDPIKKISSNDLIYKIVKNNINVISLHTNLDMAPGGVNDTLAKFLRLSNIAPLSLYQTNNATLPMGLIGTLSKPMSSKEFAKLISDTFNCQGLRFTDISESRYISKVGICSGSGGSLIKNAINFKVHAFLTGEIKHHEILSAIKENITVVDIGHFKSENIIVKKLANTIKNKFKDISVDYSRANLDKIKYISR